MATKFMSLDKPQVEKKQTVFTHYVDDEGIIRKCSNGYKVDYDNILYIGTDKYYGDTFKCWDDGSENDFVINFGVRGDKF